MLREPQAAFVVAFILIFLEWGVYAPARGSRTALTGEIGHCRSRKGTGEEELSRCAAWPEARVICGGERGGRRVQIGISGGVKSLVRFD